MLTPLAIAIPTALGPHLDRCLEHLAPALEAAADWKLPGGKDPSGQRNEGPFATPPVLLITEAGQGDDVPRTSGVGLEAMEAPSGSGFASKANLALQWAQGLEAELLLLLNDDAFLEPDALTILLEDMWLSGATAGGMLLVDADPPQAVQSAGLSVCLRRERVRAVKELPTNLAERPVPWEVDALPGTALALRPAFVLSLGGFDEDFSFYFEDVDLCLRLRQVGHRVVLCPSARAAHVGAGTIGKGPEQAEKAMRGMRMLLDKHGPGPARGGLAVARALVQQIRRGPEDLPRRLRAVLDATR